MDEKVKTVISDGYWVCRESWGVQLVPVTERLRLLIWMAMLIDGGLI